MKNVVRTLLLVIAAMLCMANTQCQSIPTTVTVTPGPAGAALAAGAEKEIAVLKAANAGLEQKLGEHLKIGAAAAGSVSGIQKAAEHINAPQDALPKEAIVAEAGLAQDALRLPENATPEQVSAYAQAALKAEQRVNMVLAGQLDAARKDYAEQRSETQRVRDAIAAKDKELAGFRAEIARLDGEMNTLKANAASELERERVKLQGLIDGKDKAIQALKDEQSAKERRLWVNAVRIVCGLLILLGVLAIALSKGEAIIQGAIMAGCGLAGIFIAMGFDILTSQPWFPWAFGVIALIAAIGLGWWLWHLWRTHQLYAKTTAAMQDLRDEASAAGSDIWSKVEEHLKFRIGGKESPLGKEMMRRLVGRGLDEPSPK